MEQQEETWYQKAYRPACGFAVALCTVIYTIFLCIAGLIAVVHKDVSFFPQVAGMTSDVALLLGVPGAAVGIAAWHRGVQQVKAVEGNTAIQVAEVSSGNIKKEN